MQSRRSCSAPLVFLPVAKIRDGGDVARRAHALVAATAQIKRTPRRRDAGLLAAPVQLTYDPHPHQGDSLRRAGIDHSDSYAMAKERVAKEIAQSAARPRNSLARCISGSALAVL
jgi:hypothetical protein